MIYPFLFLVFYASLLIYFRIADKYNIVDKPNERSSHSELTIRGGGIIYLVAALCAGILHQEYWLVIAGLLMIGTVSFIDDRITLSSKVRIIIHLLAVSMIFLQIHIFEDLSLWILLMVYIIVIGIINAYNFMDGINGITGTYSLVVLAGLQYVNTFDTSFIHADLIWLPILASIVFLLFNFRKKAKCFAGDVGSITIALWIIFLLLTLIKQTGEYRYILFLTVYGVDSILTITHRMILKQNIFDAHRLHFYQILANEQQMSHLLVSSIFSLIQLGIIIIVLSFNLPFLFLFLITAFPLGVCYILLKPRLVPGRNSR